MSPLLVGLLLVLLLPLFVGTWRASLLGLSLQGLLTAWVAWRLHPDPSAVSTWLTLLDLLLLRGLLVPWWLRREMRRQQVPARSDVIPPNMLSWTVALAVAVVAFQFAAQLEPSAGEQQAIVAVAATGVLLGFLVLSTQPTPFSQMVGVLRIDNAVALFALGGHPHHAAVAVRLAHLGTVVATIALFLWYLRLLGASGVGRGDGNSEGPTL